MSFSGLKSTLRKKSFQIHILFSVDALFLIYAAFFFFFLGYKYGSNNKLLI